MIKRLAILVCVLAVSPASWGESPSVTVEPPQLAGSRSVESLTKTAVVRDYLQAWQGFRQAMYENRPDLLGRDFVGNARDKLTATIEEQAKLGLRTRYQDRSHDLQIVFYSPEGLSIQLIDHVDYDVEVLDHDKVLTTKRMHARYVIVLTPAERWRVRVFQAGPE